MSHAPTTRPKPILAGDEEATSTLQLGEFENVPTLTNSEARVIINLVLDKRRKDTPNGIIAEPDVLTKTQAYLDTFSRFKDTSHIEQVSNVLGGAESLHRFERSQLGTLCCEQAEEAKTLVPSLTTKIGDADLESVLRHVNDLRQFVE